MSWLLNTLSKTIAYSCVVFFCFGFCTSLEETDSFSVDVSKLATLRHGSELVFLENGFENTRSYRFEDFFWTGSGDSNEEEFETKTSTVYETKTVLSTVFIESTSQSTNQTIQRPPKCIINCSPPTQPDGDITPTSVYTDYYDNVTDNLDADRQFWLLTVLKSDGKDPVLIDLKNSLAKLYKKAFQRQQERHLGINRTKRETKPADKPVKVYIHNVAKSPINGDEKIEVLYHVAVSGQPVPANTAADDMTLISDEEVVEELGYPFLIKAEPYLKASEPQSLSTSRNTWLFIGSSLAAVFVLLLAVAFLSLCITKKKRTALASENMRQIFERGHEGKENTIFTEDRRKIKKESPTYIDFRAQTSNETLRSIDDNGSQSSISSTSVSSSSLDVSPLMRTKPKSLRPKGATNKTVPLNFPKYIHSVGDSDSSEDTKRSENFESSVVSPKSYLSMPSVKSFPRCNIPEPLNKVLEPVSVLHLDLIDEPDHQLDKGYFTRHGSVGMSEDPGVIGPVVWNMHCQRMQHGVSVDEGMDEMKVANNIARMRKRFHDLLDDTFSLFGSRRDSPVDEQKPTLAEFKSHSAVNTRPNDDIQLSVKPRPKTSDLRRPPTAPYMDQPRGAWDSHVPSPLVRPLSAGILKNQQPIVDVSHILAEGQFKLNDPAVPLIAAIKNEIGKCSLPGSTTNLVGD